MREILIAIKTLLTTAFAKKNALVYLAPRITPHDAAGTLEIQVCLGDLNVLDHDGSTRRDAFQIHVGILKMTRLDHSKRYDAALANDAESLLETTKLIVNTLDGNFLNNTLVRPLTLAHTSVVKDVPNIPGLLVQMITFLGGVNTELA